MNAIFREAVTDAIFVNQLKNVLLYISEVVLVFVIFLMVFPLL